MTMQASFSELEYATKKKVTRRDRFLDEINNVTPWAALVAQIEPSYPKGTGRHRLPIGVTAVDGEFLRGEVVACVDQHGREVARGLVNYSSDETRHIMRHATREIEAILGYMGEPELIHRDNMVSV